MKKVAGWTLEAEDSSLYTEDKLWKGGRREWPDVSLPGHFPEEAVGGAKAKPSTSTENDDDTPTPRGPVHPSEPQLQELLGIRHSLTKLLKTIGVDLCKDFQVTRLKLCWKQ